MQDDDLGELLFNFVAALGVGRAFDFEVAQIDEGVQVFDFLADLLADLDGAQLDQAERLMAFCIRSLPRSMRRARLTSPSRVSSGTAPISRRYTRTGSSV